MKFSCNPKCNGPSLTTTCIARGRTQPTQPRQYRLIDVSFFPLTFLSEYNPARIGAKPVVAIGKRAVTRVSLRSRVYFFVSIQRSRNKIRLGPSIDVMPFALRVIPATLFISERTRSRTRTLYATREIKFSPNCGTRARARPIRAPRRIFITSDFN